MRDIHCKGPDLVGRVSHPVRRHAHGRRRHSAQRSGLFQDAQPLCRLQRLLRHALPHSCARGSRNDDRGRSGAAAVAVFASLIFRSDKGSGCCPYLSYGRVLAPIVMCNSTLSLSTPGTAPHFAPRTPKSRRLTVKVVSNPAILPMLGISCTPSDVTGKRTRRVVP